MRPIHIHTYIRIHIHRWIITTSCFSLLLLSLNSMAKPFNLQLCQDRSQFTCYRIQTGQTWESLFPTQQQRDLVMRINRMNIPLEKNKMIAIPNNLKNTYFMDFSPFDKQILPPRSKLIIVSLAKLAFGAYNERGNLIYWGPISGGQGYCPDIHRGCHTRIGKFFIYNKEGAGCVSTKYPVSRGGAPMPYCMFFYGGFALHGSFEVPGYNASHGCVRLFINDAQWLNQEFLQQDKKVPVIIQEN